MNAIRPALLLCLAALAVLSGRISALAQTEAIEVDPGTLARRADLVGKDVVIDDRVTYYIFHSGRGYDEIKLKRAEAVFRLPPALRPTGSPGTKPVIVRGKLKREEGQLIVDVTALRVMPDDLTRFDQAIAGLGAKDLEGRRAWAAWAEKRSKDYGDRDGALLRRAETLRTQAIRLEAAQTRGTVDAPAEWLALADKARRQGIPEPEPSALVHRALRARLASATRPEELGALAREVEKYFPSSARDATSGQTDLSAWDQPYTEDPYGTYRNTRVTATVRKALDRKLWADAVQKSMELESQQDPLTAIGLATRAETELPERKELATNLLRLGLHAAEQNVATLRGDEVRALGKAYRERLNKPEAEKELYRHWLKLKREKLSNTDADGPVDLAMLYEQLLGDRTAVKELLERAFKIDPGSKQVIEAFRTRGYQRSGDAWVEAVPGSGGGEAASSPSPEPASPLNRGLRGKTPDEVIQLLGSRPDSKILSATKGQVIEQWIFHLPARRDRYVNFLHTSSELQPRVISDRVLERPRSSER